MGQSRIRDRVDAISSETIALHYALRTVRTGRSLPALSSESMKNGAFPSRKWRVCVCVHRERWAHVINVLNHGDARADRRTHATLVGRFF